MTAPDREFRARSVTGSTEGTYDVEYEIRELPVIHVDLYRRVATPDHRPAEAEIARVRALLAALSGDGAMSVAYIRIDGGPRDIAIHAVPGGGAKACEFRLIEVDGSGQHFGVVAEIYVAAHSRSAPTLWARCYGDAHGLHRPAAPWYATRLCRGPDQWIADFARSLAWAVIER